ncbi:SRPBCC family protein [Kineococcus sp. SYSU DK003]|uniref:SRPBCC family protein n=1 Tax=Kineococcus sp. SYSU DK003 TaxID=3383124 RepID=UPI003D7CC42F
MTTETRHLTVEAPAGTPFIDTVREFDAPVAALFRAHSDPELVKQWMGPDGYETDIPEWDFRTRGSYRFVQHSPSGQEYRFNGVIHRVEQDKRIVQTFEFEGTPDDVSLESLQFVDLGGGRTRLVGHSTYPSVAARDGMVSSGMEQGMVQGYARLDALLPSLS